MCHARRIQGNFCPPSSFYGHDQWTRKMWGWWPWTRLRTQKPARLYQENPMQLLWSPFEAFIEMKVVWFTTTSLPCRSRKIRWGHRGTIVFNPRPLEIRFEHTVQIITVEEDSFDMNLTHQHPTAPIIKWTTGLSYDKIITNNNNKDSPKQREICFLMIWPSSNPRWILKSST